MDSIYRLYKRTFKNYYLRNFTEDDLNNSIKNNYKKANIALTKGYIELCLLYDSLILLRKKHNNNYNIYRYSVITNKLCCEIQKVLDSICN
ncbi:MAG: hypothetical protein E7Z87_03800 [Cyanobacteria bacterium SIG26]|nr:hypothetical protein [Cyanobacteria bacterium SIG26]